MPSTLESKVIKAPVEQIWDKFNNFHDISWAAKVLTSCEKVGELDGDAVGAKRLLNGAIHETQTEINPDNYTLRYSIDDGPSPISSDDVSNFIATVQLSPLPDGSGTLVKWGSRWDSNSDDAVSFCSGIYAALLNELAESFV